MASVYRWNVNSSEMTNVAKSSADGNCLKVRMMGTSAKACDANVALTLGKCTGDQNEFAYQYDPATKTITNKKCAEPRCVNIDASGNVQQGSCTVGTAWIEGGV